MITSEEGLRRTREAVGILESVLESLERDKQKIHPDRYAIMVEGPQEQLRELQAAIDEYLRRATSTESESIPKTPVPV